MIELYLGDGFICKVSEQDRDVIAGYTWWVHKTSSGGRFYAYTQRNRKQIYMHRLITGCPAGFLVDHKDRDGLCNIRSNLRITTGSFNMANREAWSITGYRGVTLAKGRYRARIAKDGEHIHIGMYDTAIDAARAYDATALELFGEFAWINFDVRIEAPAEEIPW